MYNISHIEEAVSAIVAARSVYEARRSAKPVLDDSYRVLFRKMGTFPPQQAAGLGYCLTPQEKAVLLEYLFTEAADSEKETLGIALLEEMDEASVIHIYGECLEHYGDEAFRPLFKKLKTNNQFTGIIGSTYGIKAEALMEALASGDIVEYLNTEAGIFASGSKGSYTEALTGFGIREGSELYRRCTELYVLVCDAGEYRRLGVERVMDASSGLAKDEQVRLLRNMLNVMDDFQLQAFVPMLEGFIELTGNKGSAQYREVLGGMSQAALAKYETWTSKYKVRRILGDGPIAKFWYDSVGQASVALYEALGTVILDFGRFVVIEIRDNEAAYFYNTEYYRDTVAEGFTEAKDAAELEEWLRTQTQWSASGGHTDHWRKAHTGQWQLAFREYLARHGA